MSTIGATEPRPAQVETASLPPVAPPIVPAGLGIASMVMAIRAASRQDRLEEGVGEMREAEVDRQAQVEARLDAMRRAEMAQHEGGFWSDIAKIAKTVAVVAAVVVGAAATVCTAGTSGVLAAMAVAALTAAPAVLPELANQVAEVTNASPEWRIALQAIALAVCIALAICNPAGAVSSTAQAGSTVSRGVRLLQDVATAVDRLGRATQAAAEIQQGHAAVRGGLATIEQGDHTATAQRREASALTAQRRRDAALDRLEDAYREAARSSRAVARMSEIENEGSQAALRA